MIEPKEGNSEDPIEEISKRLDISKEELERTATEIEAEEKLKKMYEPRNQ